MSGFDCEWTPTNLMRSAIVEKPKSLNRYGEKLLVGVKLLVGETRLTFSTLGSFLSFSFSRYS